VDALARLAEVAELIAQRPAFIRAARDEGATWEQIAQAMKMSRAGVIKLCNSASRHQPRRPTAPDGAHT
jgi:hypothetical protein